MAELHYGMERMPRGKRRLRLEEWLSTNCRCDLRAGFYRSISRLPRLGEGLCRAVKHLDVPWPRWTPFSRPRGGASPDAGHPQYLRFPAAQGGIESLGWLARLVCRRRACGPPVKSHCKAVYAAQVAAVVVGAPLRAGVKRITASSLEQNPRTPVWLKPAGAPPTV